MDFGGSSCGQNPEAWSCHYLHFELTLSQFEMDFVGFRDFAKTM